MRGVSRLVPSTSRNANYAPSDVCGRRSLLLSRTITIGQHSQTSSVARQTSCVDQCGETARHRRMYDPCLVFLSMTLTPFSTPLPIHTHGHHTTLYKRWSRSCISFRPHPCRSQRGRAPRCCQRGGIEAGTAGWHRLGVFVTRIDRLQTLHCPACPIQARLKCRHWIS